MSKFFVSKIPYRFYFWIILFGITIFRIAVAGKFGLSTDESHYVIYSQNLDWGYFDHPPMVAFLSTLTTLLGKSVFLYRLGPILCWTVSIIVLRALILLLYKSEKVALLATLLMVLMPYQNLLGLALLPDATLNLFWCCTIFCSWHAIKKGRWIMWILTGIMFGLALMSKYHGILLPGCILLYILLSNEYRHWLFNSKPYIGVLTGFLVFLPNIIWNYKHNWISYTFQMRHGTGNGEFSLIKLFENIGGQLIAASPIFFIILIVAFYECTRNKSIKEQDRFIFWTSFPVFLFFCGIGLTGKILPHWTSVGWWTGSIVLATFILRKFEPNDKHSEIWRKFFISGCVVSIAMIVFMYSSIAYPISTVIYNKALNLSIELNKKYPNIKPLESYKSEYDISNDLYGWEEIAKKVELIKNSMPRPEKTFIFCHRFYTTSQLLVYLKPGTRATTLFRKPDQYRLWFKAAEYKGWDAIFLDDVNWLRGSKSYLSLFSSIDKKIEKIKIFRGSYIAHTFYIFKYFNYNGEYYRPIKEN